MRQDLSREPVSVRWETIKLLLNIGNLERCPQRHDQTQEKTIDDARFSFGFMAEVDI